MKNIIMCGGSGQRLWPLSRKNYPKQFCDLGLEETLFEQTIKRNIAFCDQIVVITNKSQHFLAEGLLEEITKNQYKLILEPVGRNTAPAVTLACLLLDENDIVLISASDHIIKKQDEYIKVIKKAEDLAEQDFIVTFGIIPEYAETGYGYIETDGNEVVSFKEKPNMKKAEEYISKGNYLWNSGMFMFKVKTYLNELEKYSPEILEKCIEVFEKSNRAENIAYSSMMEIPSISIDNAVMEYSNILKVVPADIGWSDLGGFEALYNNFDKNENKNVLYGEVYDIDSFGSFIYGKQRTIAAIDIDNLIVIDSEDALLISKKGSSHKVKEILTELKESDTEITENHMTVYRPWGTYTVLNVGEKFKVKKMVVKPGLSLSNHSHKYRSEHWTVVAGVAEVIIDGQGVKIGHNETFYVPIGSKHKLSNPSKEELIIVETSVGENIDEKDIIRYD